MYGRLDAGAAGSQALDRLMMKSQPAYNLQNYRSFLTQNRLVALQVPPSQPIPVSDALFSLGRQAGVPILIDPTIPSGLKFRVWGNIPPSPLREAMNALAGYALLQWRWVGDSIFVTSPPELQVYFGDTTLPRSAYPGVPTAYGKQQSTDGSRAPSDGGPAYPGSPSAAPDKAPTK